VTARNALAAIAGGAAVWWFLTRRGCKCPGEASAPKPVLDLFTF
jgi:hypothetical protein